MVQERCTGSTGQTVKARFCSYIKHEAERSNRTVSLLSVAKQKVSMRTLATRQQTYPAHVFGRDNWHRNGNQSRK